MGFIKIANEKIQFHVEGTLKSVNLEDMEGEIGTLSGRLQDTTPIGLTIHAVIEPISKVVKHLYIYVSIGEITEESLDTVLMFGETFDDMSTLVGANIPAEANMNQSTLVEIANSNPAEMITDNVTTRAAASDYNPQFRGAVVSRSTCNNGQVVDLALLTFYTPINMKANSLYKLGVKINGHNGNANYYTNYRLAIPGAPSTWVVSGICEIGSTDGYFEMSGMDPQDESYNVEIPVPLYINGGFTFLPWNLNIGINTIKADRYKSDGNPDYNIARWTYNYSTNIDWDSSDPYNTNKGYAGRCLTTYHNNQSLNNYTSLYATGSITYAYSSYFNLHQYSGNYTVSLPVLTVGVIIDGMNYK